ncbi:flavocytochrome c [Desulfovibrio aminophilus]|uniref:flavocytochrome c n=1 Tax=Desulfovibrio aminophilus TaxID=81425 RepID=UPI003391201C
MQKNEKDRAARHDLLTDQGEARRTSRREMLKTLGVLAGAAVVGAAVPAEAQPVSATPMPAWDREFDVVVVGSGFAGCAASIEAKRAGADVIVLEKMAAYGGNSAINGGAFAVANSRLQAKLGIKDSVETMMRDMLKAGRGTNHEDLLRVICEGTASAYEFTLEFGVKYLDKVLQFGGHSIPRTMQTVNFTGGDIVVPLREGGKKLGVLYKNRCKLEQILTGPDGAVIGIQVREDYAFPDEKSGTLRSYKIRQGLVMATGGFSRDIRYRTAQIPHLDESVESTNHPGATAEGFQAMLAVNAVPVNSSSFQLGPWASPDEGGFGYAPQFNQQGTFPYGMMVDARTGKRFVNEMADRKTRADAELKLRDDPAKPPVYPVAFTVTEGLKDIPDTTLKAALRFGVAKKFESLEALAQHHDIPLEPLKEQVERYNQAVRDGVDKEFGKPIRAKIFLDKPPYYAMRCWPKVHFCQGGVGVNTNAEVLHMRTGKPIPGLYAAGEVVGGPHGESRLGSCSIADCLVMGRIAGKNAGNRKA